MHVHGSRHGYRRATHQGTRLEGALTLETADLLLGLFCCIDVLADGLCQVACQALTKFPHGVNHVGQGRVSLSQTLL